MLQFFRLDLGTNTKVTRFLIFFRNFIKLKFRELIFDIHCFETQIV
jgi:hypothetical protein